MPSIYIISRDSADSQSIYGVLLPRPRGAWFDSADLDVRCAARHRHDDYFATIFSAIAIAGTMRELE